MDEDSGNVINPNDDPPHGYGARNCMRLRELSKSPTMNADSYMWFALESYWIQECEGRERFDDPPLGQGSSRVGDDTAV